MGGIAVTNCQWCQTRCPGQSYAGKRTPLSSGFIELGKRESSSRRFEVNLCSLADVLVRLAIDGSGEI